MNCVPFGDLFAQLASDHERHAGDEAIRTFALLLVAVPGGFPEESLIAATLNSELGQGIRPFDVREHQCTRSQTPSIT
jgi:hypothetical protein